MSTRPDNSALIGKDTHEVPMSLQRVAESSTCGERVWIGPDDSANLSDDDKKAYEIGHQILMRLAIEAPHAHSSGHPGGSLSAYTFSYEVSNHRDPAKDQTMRMSAGHLSLLGFALEWMFGRDQGNPHLASPQAIHNAFRTPTGLPGHIEAGIGDIPFGTGPLGKGLSNALGVAFGQQYLKKEGKVDVLIADGDSQEGQVAEAMRLASHLGLDNLVVHGDWNDIQLSGLPSSTFATDMAAIAHASGWNVIEVQNGNDQAQVRAALEKADTFTGSKKPTFIAYYTTMGYGVELMEQGSNTGEKNYHGAPLSDDEVKQALDLLKLPTLAELTESFASYRSAHQERFMSAKKQRASAVLPFRLPKNYTRSVTTEKGAARKDFGATHIKNLMAADERIVVLHADLAGSGGFDKVEKDFPDRVINVGVAEANMYMMAAGMRQAGLLPVTYTFAAFGTNEARANARLIDVNTGHIPLGVLHDCTHAGLSVGEDGETHQERNYLNVPLDHTHIWYPADSNQAAAMAERGMEMIAKGTESVYVFSARSGHLQLLNEKGEALYGNEYSFDERATVVHGAGDQRDEATIISFGIGVHHAIEAAKILEGQKRTVRVLNVACIRPIDSAAIIQAALETQHLIVVEDHNTEGGLAMQVADIIADLTLPCTLARLGVRHYFPSAPANDLLLLAGLDADSIANAVEDQFAYRLAGGEDRFVSCVYSLPEHLKSSRFYKTAQPYIDKLRDDDGYINTLRELWKLRSIAPKDLPDNAALQKMLKDFAPSNDINPITGVQRTEQHDIGIV